jgi:hypothetical protein
MSTVHVEILYTPGCGAWRMASRRVAELARQDGIALSLDETRIETQAAARARRFRGSPTVLVEGLDVAPPSDEPLDYGLG